MPELKGKDTSQFEAHPINVEDIPFKEKSREKQALALRRKKGISILHCICIGTYFYTSDSMYPYVTKL